VLVRDNLIIRQVLVYRLKENLRLNKANRSSFISSSDRQLSPIYVQLRKKIQAYLPSVFEKTRVLGYRIYSNKHRPRLSAAL